MKIIILFLIFFSFSGLLPGEEYYRSNSIAMVFENIPSFRLDEFDWVLKVSGDENLEIRTLYFKNSEQERTEYSRDGINLVINKYRDDQLVSTEKYTGGLITEELLYDGSDSEEKFLYIWESGKIKKVSYFLSNEHIYDDIYIKQSNGRLKQIRRIYSESDVQASEYIYSEDKLSLEWYDTGSKAYLYRYEGDDIYLIENWNSGELVRTISYSTDDQNKLVVEKDLLNGNEIKRFYDQDERLVSEIKYLEEGITKTEFYYNGENLAEKRIASSGIREKYLYFYDESDNLKKEELFAGGILRKVVIYNSGIKTEEHLYKNNNLLLKVFYADGEKTGEEHF